MNSNPIAQQKMTILNAIENLNYKANALEDVHRLSLKVFEALNRDELISTSQEKDSLKPDPKNIAELIELSNDRIQNLINRTVTNLEKVLDLIG